MYWAASRIAAFLPSPAFAPSFSARRQQGPSIRFPPPECTKDRTDVRTSYNIS
ncbi:hypothetical protein WOLCODRAFT_26717 [Wolfiporia cocos MD-104 SS10]|uniref:Uncharacterized protein n=1 Tax=Wolfiporia cocos (strain MD-104) TaxID=742152 RepID=A0A2H3JQD9_WOLCO|nr:hypothetical protein WOLCODRAFT_26717 [Wolfiporia cocos MD-104 SS10]